MEKEVVSKQEKEINQKSPIKEKLLANNGDDHTKDKNLDSNVKVPKEITELDIHLMPGCFHTEYTDHDVAQGALYHYGTSVFSGGLQHRKLVKGSVGTSIANFLKNSTILKNVMGSDHCPVMLEIKD